MPYQPAASDRFSLATSNHALAEVYVCLAKHLNMFQFKPQKEA